jgi:hypothetical protein
MKHALGTLNGNVRSGGNWIDTDWSFGILIGARHGADARAARGRRAVLPSSHFSSRS